jgi:hypothetical protein
VVTQTFPIASSYDGQRITVDDYLKDPLRIPALILDLMSNEFIVESVLRNAGMNESGAVRFERSTPLFAQNDSDIRAEFAEVPAVAAAVGELLVAYSYERSLAIQVSDAMRRRQIVDPVNRQLTQVKNTMVKNWNQAFFTLLVANIPSTSTYAIASSDAWDGTKALGGDPTPSSAGILRTHISDAIWLVENAAYDAQGQNFFGFEPDTLIIDHTAKLAIFKSADFAKPYIGDAATDSIQYTGLLPNKIMNLDVLVSRQCPAGSAFVMQRNRLGFYSDEIPLTASPLYRDEPRKTWRSDVQRASAIGVDQPQAVCMLTGVTTAAPPAGGTTLPAE